MKKRFKENYVLVKQSPLTGGNVQSGTVSPFV